MKPFWKTNNFQVRWNEPLGKPECPYAYRWVFIFFGYSIRLHKWIRSDDSRYMHNHSWWFVTLVLKGSYIDVSEKTFVKEHLDLTYKSNGDRNTHIYKDKKEVKDHLKRWSIRYRSAYHTHYVSIPKGGCWTLLITGRPKNKWGFWINNRFMRPLRFFSRYGHPACDEQ